MIDRKSHTISKQLRYVWDFFFLRKYLYEIREITVSERLGTLIETERFISIDFLITIEFSQNQSHKWPPVFRAHSD